MFAYVDSSVILRLVLGERSRLAEWPEVEAGFTSALTEVECLRTLDRMRLGTRLGPDGLAERRTAIYATLRRLEVIALSPAVLSRAASPLPAPLGTLDALHLATAVLKQDTSAISVTMATHDEALALAARACGFTVVGA
jgi:predicted nucleic acid-binding protein